MNDTRLTPSATRLESRPGCIASAMAILGHKWTALLLRELADGPKGFCELQDGVGDINPRTLTRRLLDLQDDKIISCDRTLPHRPEYALTKKGLDLLPVLQQMAAWGTKYHA